MMNYQISDNEKRQASQLMRWLNYSIEKLDQCDDHLNLIYTPFKKNTQIPVDRIFENRFYLRQFRDKIVENFNNFKKIAFKSYVLMQHFISDTQTEKLIKSFVASVEDIEVQVNRVVDLFSNLKSDEFPQAIVTGIENIKKEIAQYKQIVDERILTHLQNNILARNWVDNISDELQEKVEKKSPLVMRLMGDRMKMLKEPEY